MINDPNKEDPLDDREFEYETPDEEMSNPDFDDPYAADSSDDLDFDDMNDDFDDDVYEPQAAGGSSLNWFNVFIFGFLALAVIGTGIFYVPRILGGASNQNAPQPQQADAVQLQNGTAEDNQQLAEQAVSQNAPNPMAQSGGLLNNPELLNDTASTEAAQETTQAPGEEVFSELNLNDLRAGQSNQQIMADNDNAQETTLNIEQVAPQDAIAQPLPVPSDAPADSSMDIQMSSDDDIIFEPLSPVEPSVAENEIVVEQPRNPTPPLQTQQDVTMADAPQNEALAEQVETLSNDVARLSAQLETFMNRTAEKAEQIENRLSQVNTDTDSSPDLQSLRSTISRLEQRIADIQDKDSEQSSAGREAQASETQTDSSQRTQPAPARQAIKPTPSRAPDWILRGASRDEAFIADPQSGTTRTVSVGDTVSGLGQVTAIAIENSRWIVRGTQGVVRQ